MTDPVSAPIPSFTLTRQNAQLEAEIMAAVKRVVASGHFILGPEVEAFERRVAERLGVWTVGVGNGSDALYLALAALGVGPGDEVITTPFTFFATAGSIVRTGARPVFADVDPETFNLSAAAALDRVGPRTRAILPVHLFGLMADVVALVEQFAGWVVEDAAQALLAAQYGKLAGTIGHAAAFSFFPTKNLGAFGDGGLVAARDEVVARRVRALRAHGATRKYYHEWPGGINSRLDALQAAILSVKWPYVDTWTERRRRLAARYRAGLSAHGLEQWVRPQKEPPGFYHVYHQFTVRATDRDALAAYLRKAGVETQVYYPYPLHLLPALSDLGYRAGDFPVAESLAREALSLPLFPELADAEVDRVVELVARFYHGAA
jgi:dTDP-4-amino-4,6-dideoxygalactose transaminase